jgi:phosphatidylglycerophosphate synthase
MSSKPVAVIITGRKQNNKPLALCNIGGINLLERHIFALFYHGTKKVYILETENSLKGWNFAKKPDGIDIEVVTKFPELEEEFYLIRGDTVFNKKFFSLSNTLENNRQIEIFSGKPTDGKKMFTSSMGFEILKDELHYIGFSRVGSGHATALARALEIDGEMGEIKLIKELSKSKESKIIQGENLFFRQIEKKSNCYGAGTLLFHSLRKPQDGIIAKLFNRPLSLPVSRVLSHTPLTPNQLSFINGLFAVASGIILAFGHAKLGLSLYISGLLGGILMQACSVYDGCDGEVARVKYQFTHFGDWLDTIVDDITNCLFFAGVATWSYFYTGQSRFIYMGIAAFLGQWISNFVMYYYLIKVTGTGNNQDYRAGFSDDEDGGVSGKILDKVKYLTKRDFHLFFFMILAIFGRLDIGAYLIFAMASGAAIIFSIQHIQLLSRGLPEKNKEPE